MIVMTSFYSPISPLATMVVDDFGTLQTLVVKETPVDLLELVHHPVCVTNEVFDHATRKIGE